MRRSEAWQVDLSALCAAIAPDPDIGPIALGADRYVAARLAADGEPHKSLVVDGLAGFADRLCAQSSTRIRDLSETALAAEIERIEGEPWFRDLVRLVEEGLYADPGNGGNLGARTWRELRYRHGLTDGPDGPPSAATKRPHPRPLADRRFDAVVVGSGAGGGIVAAQLALAGKRVLLVERGRWRSYADSGRRDHLRNHRQSRYGVNTGPEADGNPRVHVGTDGRARVTAPHEFAYHNNASCVGGGTLVYGGLAWRYHPDDFRMAAKYGVPDASALVDWPMGYDDLEPWYTLAEGAIGVAGDSTGDPNAGTRTEPYPLPPVPGGASADVLRSGAERLGIATFTPPLLINTVPRNGRPACIQCGSCAGFPCPTDAKNGTHNTVMAEALTSGNLTLWSETVATRIDIDVKGRVTGVNLSWRDDVGGRPNQQAVHAAVVVVAAGAIETSRLPLLSPSTRQEYGLGNDNGWVGRHLQGHVYTTACGLFDKEVCARSGPSVTIATTDFVHDNPGIVGGAMMADDFVMPPIMFREHAWPPARRRWGRAAEAFMRHAYPRVTQVRAPIHEIPNADSRITLDPDIRDGWGLPVARLSGQVHAESLRTADFIFARSCAWLRASGAIDIWGAVPKPRLSAYQHQAGTCRMGTDPVNAVTDRFGRVWGHENLFVCDASLHPTNGGYNPVLTIMALAFRNADHIFSTWR